MKQSPEDYTALWTAGAVWTSGQPMPTQESCPGGDSNRGQVQTASEHGLGAHLSELKDVGRARKPS